MLKKNDELEVTIERFGSNGEGIATHQGKVIFVPFAIPGEKVLIHIIFDKKNYYVGKLLKVISPSSDRVNPPCPYFEKCGGCDIQHVSYETGLDLKKDIVSDSLKKFADIKIDVPSAVPSEKQFRYRNKFAFPVGENNDGKISIGMYKKNTHEIIPIYDCLLQSEKTKTIIKVFKEYMLEEKIHGFNEETKQGDIKHIVVRESGDEFILTVVVTDKNFNNFEPLIKKLKTHFNNFGIVKNVNNFKNNVIFGNLDIFVYGLKELNKDEFGVKYSVNNRSFLQVNDSVKNKIYSKIIELLKGEKTIVDAYSGAGLLSAILAKNAEQVYGIEIVLEATKNADELKQKNNLKNLENINGDCSKILPELTKKLNGEFSLVLDPPRRGVQTEVIEVILKSLPRKIVYLSCDPATLARDLKGLKEKYEIEFVSPYDMFPQTSNVETIVSLRRKD